MKRYAIAAAVAVVLGFGAAGGARAQENPPEQGTFIEIHIPGESPVASPDCDSVCGSVVAGVNDFGVVTGYYTDVHVVPHGFLRFPDGRIVSFDAPGADLTPKLDRGTTPLGINDFGVDVGQYDDSSNIFHGYVRYPNGSFTRIDVPSTGIGGGAGTGAGQGTIAQNINLEGEIAGYYADANGVVHGFVRSPGGEFSTFDAPGAISTAPCQGGTCLGLDGTVTGFFLDPTDVEHGFVRSPDGNITVIDGPGVDTGTDVGTILAGRSLEGDIAGYVFDPTFLGTAFVLHPDGSSVSFQAPNAATGPGQGTFGYTVNALGAVAGQFTDVENYNIGFERFPDGRFLEFWGKNGGPGIAAGTWPTTNNIEGETVGYVVDATGLRHAFIWLP